MPTTRTLTYSTQITHIGSGASMAAGAMSGTADISTALSSTNLGRYPLADIAVFISTAASVAAASNSFVLYRRDINFDGTNDEPAPSTAAPAWRQHVVGVGQVPPWTAASSGYYLFSDVPLSDQCEFYIENTLNATVAAGWTMKVTPKTDSYA